MASTGTRSLASIAAATVALGAVSFAALPGKNSVTSNDIGKGEVGKSEIKRNAVGFSELRTGSVRGSEVDESTLAKVPSAANADTLGGKLPAQFETRWALVSEAGVIERQSGGFAIVNCYVANANCYIDAGADVTGNGLSATIAVANTDGSAILSGEAGVAPCGAAFVACAPPGTESGSIIVVAPRASDGTVPGGVTPPSAANAARFYVFVTGTKG